MIYLSIQPEDTYRSQVQNHPLHTKIFLHY